MQCNSEKFQPGQIEFLTENREGIKATLDWVLQYSTKLGLLGLWNKGYICLMSCYRLL